MRAIDSQYEGTYGTKGPYINGKTAKEDKTHKNDKGWLGALLKFQKSLQAQYQYREDNPSLVYHF